MKKHTKLRVAAAILMIVLTVLTLTTAAYALLEPPQKTATENELNPSLIIALENPGLTAPGQVYTAQTARLSTAD